MARKTGRAYNSRMHHRKRTWHTAAGIVLALTFAAFAAVQLNDTNPAIYHRPSVLDAWSWVFFYGFIAALCATSVFRDVSAAVLKVAAIICLVEMARTAPGLYANLFVAESFSMTATSMASTRPEVELSREFFGALIALFAVGFLIWQARAAQER